MAFEGGGAKVDVDWAFLLTASVASDRFSPDPSFMLAGLSTVSVTLAGMIMLLSVRRLTVLSNKNDN